MNHPCEPWSISALAPSDLSITMGGKAAKPGEGSWVWELTGELVLWGGAARDKDPFIWVFPAALKSSASPFPFGITSELKGSEREVRREALRNLTISLDKLLWTIIHRCFHLASWLGNCQNTIAFKRFAWDKNAACGAVRAHLARQTNLKALTTYFPYQPYTMGR